MAHEMDLTDAERYQRDEADFYKPLPKAPFPAPPPFWKHFTRANVDQLASSPADATLSYPLVLLRPPPPPPSLQTSYLTFDKPNPIDTTPHLPSGETLLFDPEHPNLNHAVLLSRLTKSLLLHFLEFTTILADAPTERADKMDDIQRLVKNVIAVINMYRPHQARESVKEMLKGMLDDGKREMEECDRLQGEVHTFLDGVQEFKKSDELRDGASAMSGVNGHAEHNQNGINGAQEDEDVTEARRLWRIVHEIADD